MKVKVALPRHRFSWSLRGIACKQFKLWKQTRQFFWKKLVKLEKKSKI